MKAIIIQKNGPPEGLQLVELPKPSPGDNDLLIKVHAATVTSGDVIVRNMRFPLPQLFSLFPGFVMKKTPGHEFAGQIEAIGKDVSHYKVGDMIFGTTTGLKVGGAAEYICVPEEWPHGVLALMPENYSYAEAAALPVGGMTARYLMKRIALAKGQSALIYGASGSVGTYALQLAKALGMHVTAVSSAANHAMLNTLGADVLIDYTKEDYAQGSSRYDLVFDAVGKTSKARAKHVLNENGHYLSIRTPTKEEREDLLFLKDLAEAGQLTALIDRHFALADLAEAHRYVESKRKRGNVVIDVAS